MKELCQSILQIIKVGYKQQQGCKGLPLLVSCYRALYGRGTGIIALPNIITNYYCMLIPYVFVTDIRY